MIQFPGRHFLELVLYKTYADLKAERQRTYLGFLWWIFEPIMYMSVFYLVFGILFRQRGEHFVQFLLIGLVCWQWTRACLSHGANTILAGHHLMQRVHLPKLLFPSVLVLTDTIKFALIFVLLLIFLWSSGFTPGPAYLALLPLLLIQLLLTTGATLLLAALVPFVPDLRFVVDNLLHALFFLSGIFFSIDLVPEAYRTYFFLNPMAALIEAYRVILLHGQWPPPGLLLPALIVGLAMTAAGLAVIRRFEYVYPRITP